MNSTVARHRGSVIALHWFTVLALCAGLIFVLTHDAVENRSVARNLMEMHREVGVAVLVVASLRAILNLIWRTGSVNAEGLKRPQRVLRAGTHALLYLGLMATPVLGWLLTNARGQAVHFLGLTLPTLIDRDRDLADSLQSWHQTLAWSLVVLALLHAFVALWHHFARRDGVLVSILPRRPLPAPTLAPDPFDSIASGDSA